MRFQLVFVLKTFLLLFSAITGAQNAAECQNRSNLGDIYRQEFQKSARTNNSVSSREILATPLSFNDGSTLTIVYPERWQGLANSLRSSLNETHKKFQEYFGEIPAFQSSLRIMDEDIFYLSTGAPSWTNALFYKGQIMIPVPSDKEPDFESIVRSVKHEYTHAIINAISGGNCPGWLDEGLAQWAEGEENPALQPALYGYLKKSEPVPLSLLQNGFTKLETKIVPAAYAQSLYATHTLINTFGISKIGNYLSNLRSLEKDSAFKRAFSMSDGIFEDRLATSLKNWQRSYKLPQASVRLARYQ